MNNNTKKKIKKKMFFNNQLIFKLLRVTIREIIQCILFNSLINNNYNNNNSNNNNNNSNNIYQISKFKSQLCLMLHQNLQFINQVIRVMCHFSQVNLFFIDLYYLKKNKKNFLIFSILQKLLIFLLKIIFKLSLYNFNKKQLININNNLFALKL